MMDRRNFLKSTGIGMATMAAGVAGAQTQPTLQRLGATRPMASGNFALELDGAGAGWLMSADGGSAYADVVTERAAPDRIVHKHISAVRYEEIMLGVGAGMSKGFYSWIKAALDRKYERRNGAIIAADFNMREVSRLTFAQALITEIGFPALDAASKDAAKMTLKVAPEYTRRVQPAKAGALVQSVGAATIQKRWLPSNFRLKIDGLPVACSRVNKIEALTFKQKVTGSTVGEQRDYQKEPANLEVPNLVITFPESHAKEFYDWHEDFVIKGNCGQDREKSGTLECLSPTLAGVLFTLTFKNLGIFKLTPDKNEAGSDSVRRVKAEMYCEQVSFDFPAAAA